MIAAFDNYDGPVNIIDFSTGDTLYDWPVVRFT